MELLSVFVHHLQQNYNSLQIQSHYSDQCNPEFDGIRLASSEFTEWPGQTHYRQYIDTTFCKGYIILFLEFFQIYFFFLKDAYQTE